GFLRCALQGNTFQPGPRALLVALQSRYLKPGLPCDRAAGLEAHVGPYHDVEAPGAEALGMSADELRPDLLGFRHLVVDEGEQRFRRIEPPLICVFSIAADARDRITGKHAVAVLAAHENIVGSNGDRVEVGRTVIDSRTTVTVVVQVRSADAEDRHLSLPERQHAIH